MYDVGHPLQRLEDVAFHDLPPHEQALLRAQVRERPENVDPSARGFHRPVEVLDEKSDETLLHVVHDVLVDEGISEEVLQPPNEPWSLVEVRVAVEDREALAAPDVFRDMRVVHVVTARPRESLHLVDALSVVQCASRVLPFESEHGGGLLPALAPHVLPHTAAHRVGGIDGRNVAGVDGKGPAHRLVRACTEVLSEPFPYPRLRPDVRGDPVGSAVG